MAFGGRLRKEGKEPLTLRSVAPYVLDRAAVEVAGGEFFMHNGSADTKIRNGEVRFCRDGDTAEYRWYHTSKETWTVDGTLTVYVGEGQRNHHNGWINGTIVKTGPGALALCLNSLATADIREGTYLVDDENKTNCHVTVHPGAAIGFHDGSFHGILTLMDGACINPIYGVPNLAGDCTPEIQGGLRVLGRADRGKVGDKVLNGTAGKTVTEAIAKKMTVDGSRFRVAANGNSYVLAEASAVQMPDGSAAPAPGSKLDLLVGQALAQTDPAKPVRLDLAASGKTITAEAAEKALTVFKNIADMTTDAEGTVLTVAYDFGITAAKVNLQAQQVTFTASLTDGRNAAALADGARIRIYKGDTVLQTQESASMDDGQTEFTVSLEPGAPLYKIEAFK